MIMSSRDKPDAIERFIKAKLPTKNLERVDRSVSAGSLNTVRCYSIDGDKKIFVKRNGELESGKLLEGEFESLKAISLTKTVRVPEHLLLLADQTKNQQSALVLEYLKLDSIDDVSARLLGQNLASLHNYNFKMLKYSQKASSWVGGNPPSMKRIIEHQQDENDEYSSDQDIEDNVDSRTSDEDDSGNEAQFKIIRAERVTEDDRINRDLKISRTDDNSDEKFVPEPGTKPINDFGFHMSTACGIIPQTNEWTSEWISFFARYRLEKPVNSIIEDYGDRKLLEEWSHLQLKVGKFFRDYDKDDEDDVIKPALLHGDLWSGNMASILDTPSGQDDSNHYESESHSNNDQATSEVKPKKAHRIPVIYDTSSFYGHNEYDFGIARMFGGIPSSFEQEYFKHVNKKKNFEMRNKLYQLFHHLNHWQHFGSGYKNSSLKLMNNLNSMV